MRSARIRHIEIGLPVLLLIGTLLLLPSCRKDPLIPIINSNDCSQMYFERTSPYTNPYTGTLETGSVVGTQPVYLEPYGYYRPCSNPSNPFQICYLREDNINYNTRLYKYDFCTGISTLITANAALFNIDWSVKDWILFTGKNGNLFKIKSNGDSLTQLTNDINSLQYNPKWNTTGTIYVWNRRKVADEHGNLLYNLPEDFISNIAWYDKYSLISIRRDLLDIKKYNVTTGQISYFTGLDNIHYIANYNRERNEFIATEDSLNHRKHFVLDLNTQTRTYLTPYFQPQSFMSEPFDQLGDKILVEQRVNDTMTGSPGLINVRRHIAIVDRDGSNLRRIIFPE